MTKFQPFTLLLQGGHVIDSANSIDGQMDVAIKGDAIAEVSPAIDPSRSEQVLNVEGLYVTPGLVDMHTHHFAYIKWIFPDEYALPNGVTTVVDAGGAGWKSYEEFKDEIIDKAQTRVLAFLNIVGAGMLGAVEQDLEEMEVEPCAEMIQEHRDSIIGIKSAHYEGPSWEAIDRAVEVAEMGDVFAMVDFRQHPERSHRELLMEHLRPGDVYTHIYAAQGFQLDGDGRIRDYMIGARRRGVLFDLGHGKGGFNFAVARKCIDQGFGPDIISSDAHRTSILLQRAAMPIAMSKLINMGMPLPECVDRATRVPATVIGRPELGTLSVGAEADIAVLEMEHGDFGFLDSARTRMTGEQRLLCHMTIRSGQVAWDLNGISRPAWDA